MNKKLILKILKDIFLAIAISIITIFGGFFIAVFGLSMKLNAIITILLCLAIPVIFMPLFFYKLRKKLFIFAGIYVLGVVIAVGINIAVIKYEESLVVDTNVNINTEDYLPFVENSKIYKLEKEASLKFTKLDDLPVVDGAAAVFPVYSAFVNAVYPNNVELHIEPFLYTNTVNGYNSLANRNIDIFFGAYPSEEQIEYAKSMGTEFEYTKIGKEAFVFFVNKDNPVDSLTIKQIQDIYSGKITNWKEVGGNDEEIIAFQRNEGSGSQSMLKRFMGENGIMEAPTTQVNDFMVGIINQVSDYKNYSNSIGFSFRYYLEGIIKNSNVKMIKVDGIEPTVENIRNEKYSITTSLYAVTYKNNSNLNVQKLINWVLSDEGQEIIEKTGYARIK